MANETGGWRNRLSLVRQALSRHPNTQRLLDEAVREAQAESTKDGMEAACLALDAYVDTLRGRTDVTAADVLAGIEALVADMRKQEVPHGAR